MLYILLIVLSYLDLSNTLPVVEYFQSGVATFTLKKGLNVESSTTSYMSDYSVEIQLENFLSGAQVSFDWMVRLFRCLLIIRCKGIYC